MQKYIYIHVWGNWVAFLESRLWASVETVNEMYIIILSNTEGGPTSEGLAASDLLGDGWKGCWLSSLLGAVSHGGDSPRRGVMETLVLRGGRARGRAELPLEGKADADPLETLGAASSSTFALVDLALSWLSPGPWNRLGTLVCFMLASNSASV